MKVVLKLEVTVDEFDTISKAWKKSGVRSLDDLVLTLLKEKANAPVETKKEPT